MSGVITLPSSRLRDFPGIQQTRNGVRTNLYNACILFRSAAEFSGRIAYNDFAMRTLIMAPLPWSDEADQEGFEPRPWTEHDDNFATEWAQRLDLQVTRSVIEQAVETVAYENRFHPVRQYLSGLTWDGKPRLRKMLPYYFGAEPTPYSEAVGPCWMISAVARVYDPGSQVDHVPVFEGAQGIGKTSALGTLFSPWFTDELADLTTKDASMQTLGVWCIEISELDAMRRAEAARIKSFMSRRIDRFRPPYGRRLIESRRQCVFAGTTNSDAYLKDETGNRRFWPIRCGSINLDALAADRGQLWAEALALYGQGERWWLDSDDLRRLAAEEQGQRDVSDPWEGPIDDHIAQRAETSVAEILDQVLHLRKGEWTQGDQNRVVSILKRRRWARKQVRIAGSSEREWRYVRPYPTPADDQGS